MSNPTLLVATFDETLALTDTNGAGTWTGVDPIRYAEVGSADGLWLEEATTNSAVNPSFEPGIGGVIGWGSSTRTQDDEHVRSGDFALKVAVTGAGGGCLISSGAALGGSGQTWTVSSFVWAATGVTVAAAAYARYTDASEGVVGSAQNIAGNDDWQRAIRTVALDGAKTIDSIRIRLTANNGQTFWVDDFQAERNKSYATSPANGSLGTGYAWTGTAHASTSTRAESSAYVDPTDRIDPVSGAIALRYKRLIDTGNYEYILYCGTGNAGEDYFDLFVHSTGKLGMSWQSDGGTFFEFISDFSVDVGVVHFIYVDWDGTTIRCSVDNGLLESDTRDDGVGDWGGVNLNLTVQGYGSSVIGPFAIFDRPLTSKEITNVYEMETWRFDMLTGTGVNVLMPRMNVRNNTLLRR